MIHRFDRYELDTAMYELRSDGVVVPVEPQVFNVLRCLIGHRDSVVTKEQLLDEVWGDRFVSESAITSRIKAARRALGDDGQTQWAIKTVRGRGYRFVPELTEIDQHVGASTTGLSPNEESMPLGVAPHETVIVERDHVRRFLGRLIDRAIGSRQGAFVVIAGEAGIGKTAVVDAIRRDIGDRARVLIGWCDDLVTPRAMGPLHDIALGTGGELADALRTSDRDSAMAALIALLSAGPTLIVVEDVHWADDATLDMVRLLARRVASLPAVLVVTLRDEGSYRSNGVVAAIGTLTGSHVSRVDLAPLSHDGVRQLARGRSDATALFEVTRGNPFFVSEVLRSGLGSVPRTVRDAVLGRMVQLTPAAQTVVSRLSVVPGRAERWLAEALSRDHGASLSAAEHIGLLASDASHVWFRHELARRAVESAMTAGEHIRASQLVLEQLVRADDVAPSRLVHHALAVNDVEALLEYGPRAASDAARLGSHAQAVEHFSAVLRHGDRLSVRQAAFCTRGLGFSLYLLDRFNDASRHSRRAVQMSEETGDPLMLADALSVSTRATMFAIGPAAARAEALRAVELLDDLDDPARLARAYIDLARAGSNLSTLGLVHEPSDESLTAAEHAIGVAEAIGRTDLLHEALIYRGSARVARGDSEGFDDLDRAIAFGRANHPETAARACVNAAGCALRDGRLDNADRYIETGLAVATEHELHAPVYRLALTGDVVNVVRGRWDAAIAGLRDLVEDANDPGKMRQLARSLLARLLARRGDLVGARTVLQPAVDEATGADEIRLLAPVATAVVETAWIAHDDPLVLPVVHRALEAELAPDGGGAASRAELQRYLARAGHHVEPSGVEPDPWHAALCGNWAAAADGWRKLGDRYEEALELRCSDAPEDHDTAIKLLESLGAKAVVTPPDVDRENIGVSEPSGRESGLHLRHHP